MNKSKKSKSGGNSSSKTSVKSTSGSKISTGTKVAVGAGIAAVAAASAGAYYFMGPKGKTHQKEAALWARKMKKEAEDKINKVKDMTEPMYTQIVDTVASKYSKEYREHSEDVRALASALKKNWRNVKKLTKPAVINTKKAERKVKKAVS